MFSVVPKWVFSKFRNTETSQPQYQQMFAGDVMLKNEFVQGGIQFNQLIHEF